MDNNFGYINQSMKYLLYITVGLLVLFIILLIVNYTLVPVSFLSFITTVKKDEFSPQEEVPIKPVTIAADRPLENSVKLDIKEKDYNSTNFTLSFDCYVSRNYKSIDVPRVLFYFGGVESVNITRNADLKETKITDASNNGLDKQPNILVRENSDLIDKFSQTNFIIYLDPIRNDMKIGVFLKDSATTPKTYLEMLPVIKNIPIEQPFQITFILGTTFAEIYKDKQLLFTHRIGSILKKQYPSLTNFSFATVPMHNRGGLLQAPHLYGPISFIGSTVRVGNIQFFTSKLDGKYVRLLTNDIMKPEFFKKY